MSKKFPGGWRIYKLQRPLAGDMTHALAYTESGRTFMRLPMTPELLSLFETKNKKGINHKPKIFVRARRARGEFQIDAVVSDQAW